MNKTVEFRILYREDAMLIQRKGWFRWHSDGEMVLTDPPMIAPTFHRSREQMLQRLDSLLKQEIRKGNWYIVYESVIPQ